MISVVIPCLNEVGYIESTLQSLIRQEDPREPWEVIVADGGSDDGTRMCLDEMSQQHANVRWVDNLLKTTPNALNLGIEEARGDTIIILGAHAEVDTDFLIRNAELLKAHPESGCVGGVVEQVHGSASSRRIGAAMSTPFGVGDARFRTGGASGHVDTVAFGAYRKSVFEEIGLFDSALTRNQDDELNYRLLKSGWRIWFDPRIRSRYHVRSTYPQLLRQYFQYGYWKVFVNRKHGTITTWRQVIPALFLMVLFIAGAAWILEVFWSLERPLEWIWGFYFYDITFLVVGRSGRIGHFNGSFIPGCAWNHAGLFGDSFWIWPGLLAWYLGFFDSSQKPAK